MSVQLTVAPVRRIAGPFTAAGYPSLWTGAVLTATAMWIERVAIGWYIFEATDSAFLTSAAVSAQMGAGFFFGPFGGAIADRSSRPRVLSLAIGGRALTIVGLAALTGLGSSSMLLVFALLALGGACQTLHFSSLQTLSVDLVGAERRASAISLVSIGQHAVSAAGALGSGFMVTALGPTFALGMAAVLTGLGALAYYRIREPRARKPLANVSLLKDTVEGLRTVARVPLVAILLGLMIVIEIFGYSFFALTPAIADRVLGVGVEGLGGLNAATPIGGVFALLFLAAYATKLRMGVAFLVVYLLFGGWWSWSARRPGSSSRCLPLPASEHAPRWSMPSNGSCCRTASTTASEGARSARGTLRSGSAGSWAPSRWVPSPTPPPSRSRSRRRARSSWSRRCSPSSSPAASARSSAHAANTPPALECGPRVSTNSRGGWVTRQATSPLRPITELFATPGFTRLWAGAVLFALGAWTERVVIGWYVFDKTDSAFITAMATAAFIAPGLIVGPIAGTLSDSLPRPRILASAALLKSVTILGIALLARDAEASLPLILVLLTISGIGLSMNISSLHTLSGDLVGASRRARAISVVSTGQRGISALGALGAGALITAFGATPAFLLAVGALALSGLFYRSIPEPAARRTAHGSSLMGDTIEGLRLVTRVPLIAVLLGLTVIVEVFGFAFNALFPAVAERLLGGGATRLGALVAAASLGGVAGTLLLAALSDRGRLGLVFLAVIAVFGASMAAIGVSTWFAVSLVLAAVIGACAAMFDALQWILLQAGVDDALRGRALGAWNVAIGFGWLGPLLLGAIADTVSVTAAFALAGAVLVVTAAVVTMTATQLRSLSS